MANSEWRMVLSLNSHPAPRPACGRGLCSCPHHYFPHAYLPTDGHADAHALPVPYGHACLNCHAHSYPYAYPNTYCYANLYPHHCSHRYACPTYRHICSYLYSHTCSAHCYACATYCYAGTCTASLCPCPPARPGIRHPG